MVSTQPRSTDRRRLVYYVAATVDGFIAGPNGENEFFGSPEDLTQWVRDHLPEALPARFREAGALAKRFDCVLIGRNTWQIAADAGVPAPYPHLTQYVFSSTLESSPHVEVVADDPVGFVRELKAREGRDIWLLGGAGLASQLATEVDEIIVKQYPIVIGSGMPLAFRTYQPDALRLIESNVLASGIVVSHYSREPG